ncbi:MAG TPA: hypothetical protein VGD79_08420 [Thermoanaerobaculia bacterium]
MTVYAARRYSCLMRALLCCMLISLGLAVALPVSACSPRIFLPHTIDRSLAGSDTVPPDQPEIEIREIRRGHGPLVEGDVIIVNTCASIGSALLRWTALPQDDATQVDKLGITWRLVRGSLPPGLREPDQVELLPNPENGYLLDWNDGDTDGENTVDFEVVVFVIDLAGNRSVASAPLHIQHRGRGSE